MIKPPYTYFIQTEKGVFTVKMSTSGKIQKLFFPDKIFNQDLIYLPQPEIIKNLSADLNNYFKGKHITFSNYEIELKGTDFQMKVWNKIKNIPYGSTMSYGELALSVKSKAYRAIGNACGKNPVPILIPCHRVVAKNNKIGGFSSGTEWKFFLLSIEQNKKFYN